MMIEIPMYQFGTHGCTGTAVYQDGGVSFEGQCVHCGENGFQYEGAATAALQYLAANVTDADLMAQYHARVHANPSATLADESALPRQRRRG